MRPGQDQHVYRPDVGLLAGEDAIPRRFVAVLTADVIGYTSLMEADEVGTVRRFGVLRGTVLDPVLSALAPKGHLSGILLFRGGA
jgi:class 3 adenylate cyclase